jgi:protein-disulfide isomerase
MRITQPATRHSIHATVVRRSVASSVLLIIALGAALFTPEQSAAPKQVIITEFSDFQCPYCKRAAPVVERLRQTYGARVAVVFKQMPLKMHQRALKAAEASLCARAQGKFWEYHDRLFAADDLSVDELNRIAATVGLNQTDFSQCLSSEKSKAEVEQDVAEAERLGVSGTPTFFVNGRVLKGAASFPALQKEINGALANRQQSLPQRLPTTKNENDSPFAGDALTIPAEAPASKNSAVRISDQPVSSIKTAADVTLSPATIDFPYQLVGTTSTMVIETVTNSGNAPLLINEIAVIGPDRNDFKPAYTFSLPVTVAPGDHVNVSLTFTPAAPWRPGTRDASLKINHTRGVDFLDLKGTGANCGGPMAGCLWGCADGDGDGLNDDWERAGGVDLNNDGKIDATNDLLLSGAAVNKPDIFVWYDWMDYGLDDESCADVTDCTLLGKYHFGETCSDQGQCVYSCSNDSDCTSRWPAEAHAGERCVSNVCEHTHDPLVLDANAFQPVVTQFAAHGINLHILRGNPQPHSHVISLRSNDQMTTLCEGGTVPGDSGGLGKYAESFYDLKSRSSSPDKLNLAYHYTVFSHYTGCDSVAHCPASPFNVSDCQNPTLAFGQSGFAELSGNDFIVSMGGFVNNSALSPRFEVPAVFMHELGHNLGLRHDGHLDKPCRDDVDCPSGDTCIDLNDTQGRVCHESFRAIVGKEEPNYKPNYLSIMNYAYQTDFIRIGAAPGARVPRGCSSNAECAGNGAFCVLTDMSSHCSVSGHICNASSDCPVDGESCVSPTVPTNTCSTTGYACVSDSDCPGGDSCRPPSRGYCARIDYSRQTLPTGGATPGALDESNLDDNVGLGSGTSDLFFYTDGRCHFCPRAAPSDGPVNWAGSGVFFRPDCSLHLSGVESFTDTGVRADIDGHGFCSADPWGDLLHGHTDWPDFSGIPFNYTFQCRQTGGN